MVRRMAIGVGALALVAVLAVALPTTGPVSATTPFTDVPVDHPFRTEITWAAELGIAPGQRSGCATGDPCFHPGDVVTRQEAATLLHRTWLALGGTDAPDPDPDFADVPVGHPAHADVAWMVARGITTGATTGCPGGSPCYRPGDVVTRQAMAAFLYRAWLALGGRPSTYPTAGFTDVGPAHPFRNEIAWAAAFGVAAGQATGCATGNPCYRPGDAVTRQSAAAFLYRLAHLPDVG